jgi:hypothetical protein
MFGIGKTDSKSDKLSVQVHAVTADEPFGLAQKLWDENAAHVQLDELSGKEYLHFAYTNPACVVWFQRDRGRTDEFELIVRWESTKTYEVYVLSKGAPTGNAERAKALLNSMLTTPSVVTT